MGPEVTTPTTPEVTTPEVTTPTVEQCTYKNFVYEPGQMIGIVMMQENCFLVLCDKDSQIRKKRVSCPTTTTPAETTTSSIIIEETTTPIGSTTTAEIIETTTPENVIETTTPFKEEFCVWNHFNYEAGQIIGTVITDGHCYLVYCDQDSNIANRTVECSTTTTETATTTTPEPIVSTTGETEDTTTPIVPTTTPIRVTTRRVIDTTPPVTFTSRPFSTTPDVHTTTPGIETTTPSICKYKDFMYNPGDVIGIIVVKSGCYLMYCDSNSHLADKTTTPYNTPDTTTPEDKTTTPFETPASTTPGKNRCVYNNFEYTPGQEIGKVKFNGRCYVISCDLDSKIV